MAAWRNPYSADLTPCTAYVAQVAHDAGWDVGSRGSATTWIAAAEVRGYRVNNKPAPGAIAVWLRGYGGAGVQGHVAVVVQVDLTKVEVDERNWPGGAGPRYRWVPVSDISGFIHPEVEITPGEQRNPVLGAVSWVLFERSILGKTAQWWWRQKREWELQAQAEREEAARQRSEGPGRSPAR